MRKGKTTRAGRKAPKLLTPRAAADSLGIHPDTLARWCDDGEHGVLSRAAVRLPKGHRRYREDLIDTYRAQLVREAGAA